LAWTVEFNAYADRKLRRVDAQARSRILKYLQDNLEGIDDARILGRALRGNPPNRWRYRAGNYRIIPGELEPDSFLQGFPNHREYDSFAAASKAGGSNHAARSCNHT